MGFLFSLVPVVGAIILAYALYRVWRGILAITFLALALISSKSLFSGLPVLLSRPTSTPILKACGYSLILLLSCWAAHRLLTHPQGWEYLFLVILEVITVASAVLLLISLLVLLDEPTSRATLIACVSGLILPLSCWAGYHLGESIQYHSR